MPRPKALWTLPHPRSGAQKLSTVGRDNGISITNVTIFFHGFPEILFVAIIKKAPKSEFRPTAKIWFIAKLIKALVSQRFSS